MTDFELKIIEFLDEDAVELLWKQAVKEARENAEGENDIAEYARNLFIDLLSDYFYDEVRKFNEPVLRDLVEAAFEDTDKEHVADYIIRILATK